MNNTNTFDNFIQKAAVGTVEQADIVNLLTLEGKELQKLYLTADIVRKNSFGDDIFLRGIIEFSNYCSRRCNYCGINACNSQVPRYRMMPDEIVAQAKVIAGFGIQTVVLQAGEDDGFSVEMLCQTIRQIKSEIGMRVTLSVGEMKRDSYLRLQQAGMDRFLLRFETCSPELFDSIHQDGDLTQRLACLNTLQELGVQTGSGFMIGLPDETLEQLAADILFCTRLNLDMIGCGPFVPQNQTSFASKQNPLDPEIFFKVLAILRILNPLAHIPATTAFDAVFHNGRMMLLRRGCNVYMPNFTPVKYREKYALYDGKPVPDADFKTFLTNFSQEIASFGRRIGEGAGDSLLVSKQP